MSRITEFESLVYEAVRKIPLGETRTYGWVAREIGRPRSARAVGNALHKNPYAPDVPCHRVVASGGRLGGFARGAEAKRRLLNDEAAAAGKERIW